MENVQRLSTHKGNSEKEATTKARVPQEIIAAVIALGFIAIAGWYIADVVWYQEQHSKLKTLTEQFSELKARNDEDEHLRANANELEKKLADAESNYKRLRPLIPSEAELPQILDWIAQQARMRGLKLDLFSQGQGIRQQGNITEIPVQVEVGGYYDAVNRFVEDFTRFERVLRVRGVRMVQSREQSQYQTVQATINFSAYVGKENFTQK